MRKLRTNLATVAAATALILVGSSLTGCEVKQTIHASTPKETARATATPPRVAKMVQRQPGKVLDVGKLARSGKIIQLTAHQPKPDAADTAKKPPTAKDLARYTRGIPGRGKLHAQIQTSMGTFNCELFEKQAPLTVANFVGLARGLKAWTDPKTRKPQVGKKYFDGLIFHRVIPNFMIQGGDPLGVGMGGPGYQIRDEFHPTLKHDRGGLLSMANAGPNTGGSQFFVTERPTPHLNNRHAIFGACKEIDLVKKIARVPRGGRDRPNTPVSIKTIKFSRK